MIYHRYPLRSLIRDYVRAAAGFAIAAVPLAIGQPGGILFVMLLALALLFLGYGLRTLGLQLTAYELRPGGIACHGPRRRKHDWDKVSAMRLRYYSTTRDKNQRDLKHGWLELTIVSPAGKTRIDSEVEGFAAILEAAAGAADAHDIAMDETTVGNFKAFRAEATQPPARQGGGAGR
jgi:hypothetical protein